VIDDLSSGREGNLEAVRDRIVFTRGDVTDEEAARACVEECEAIFHLAAIPSVVRSMEKPLRSHRANTRATLLLLEAARRHGVRRFVYASSSSVYGCNPVLPKQEEQREEPLSPYAAQKLLGEHYLRIYAQLYGLQTVTLRFFNVFGPRQDPSSPYSGVISIFMARLLSGRAPEIQGTGEQSRDFTYVANVVDALVKAAERDLPAGDVINVATARRITVNELAERLRRLTGGPEPVHVAERPGDVPHSLADIERARERLGYRPLIELDEGLERTLSWFRDQGLEQLKEHPRNG
jgi:UDP-glucose 4-epimerase